MSTANEIRKEGEIRGKHAGERFYAFHNARLYNESGEQVASLQDPVFLSYDITEKDAPYIEELNERMKAAHGFLPAIQAEENGRLYAVFQMFADERTAFAYLKKELERIWGEEPSDTFGIFEKITEHYEADVETKDGIVAMKGRYVDNYYLKRTKGNT